MAELPELDHKITEVILEFMKATVELIPHVNMTYEGSAAIRKASRAANEVHRVLAEELGK